MVETGFAKYLFNHSGRPVGTFLRPSISSEYAISFDLYPKFLKEMATPYARTASPRLPMWGIPEAPIPLSTLIWSNGLPRLISLSIIPDATLSNQVPLPITWFFISFTRSLTYTDHLDGS